MSFPAARITSTTVHGGIVTLGTPRVLVGNMPASRIGDMHTCALLSPNPHVGGPMILGAFNVLSAGPPQSRVLDTCVCASPAPDMVALGEFTVLVGMAGAFAGGLGGFLALVLGGLLSGLKNLTNGYPRAVLDEDGNVVTEYAPGVRIEGTPEFQARVIQDLDTIASTESGRQTLDRMAASGHTTTIRETNGGNGCDTYDDPSARLRDSVGGENGDGTDSVIDYNPDRTSIGDGSQDWMDRPPDVGLYHELHHAADAGEGSMDPGETDIDGRTTRRREAQAVGIGPYAGDDATENTYRSERGEPQRTYY